MALALALVALTTNLNLDWRLVDPSHLHVGIFSTNVSPSLSYQRYVVIFIDRRIGRKNITSWPKISMDTSAMNILEAMLIDMAGNRQQEFCSPRLLTSTVTERILSQLFMQ